MEVPERASWMAAPSESTLTCKKEMQRALNAMEIGLARKGMPPLADIGSILG